MPKDLVEQQTLKTNWQWLKNHIESIQHEAPDGSVTYWPQRITDAAEMNLEYYIAMQIKKRTAILTQEKQDGKRNI